MTQTFAGARPGRLERVLQARLLVGAQIERGSHARDTCVPRAGGRRSSRVGSPEKTGGRDAMPTLTETITETARAFFDACETGKGRTDGGARPATRLSAL
jgi:hypothetical protein